ncbi:GyrI-like domain-containing protein [Streptomyces sp. N2-109]|uniref:GyrI-like domain-containing protein n=1 Tax=Streptomyces gossypii TaxID=2883101 RepID=A0ABT2JKJ8_9ACTN|nr:GyrI-like domain-containing protein [Streptomyces gossypii]MCT2588404.1 GyrI-like domain-containing protein [Streptomyces gossypii]
MSSGLSAAELTLLGLLVEQPRHGYELEAVIAERGMREWTEIGFSSIYYLMTKLRERGLIAQTDASQSGSGKGRKVYAATAEGRRACATAAQEAIAQPHPLFPRVLVGLANQPALGRERLLDALDQRSRALAERVEDVRRAASQERGAPEFVRAIFDYSLSQLSAEQVWLARYRASLADAGAHLPGSETPMAPYDVKREHKELYAPKNTAWAVVDVPQQQFIAVDGAGDPNTSPAYASAVEALYAVAYTLKFAGKRTAGGDFVVAPLEGLWWSDQPDAFTTRAKDAWKWTMLISLPSWITKEMTEEAGQTALARKKLPAISLVRHLTLREGPSAQVLHIGSYDDEAPVLEELHHTFLGANGLRASGLHHEIYLGDPRKSAPEKLKTILRQPVEHLGR